MAILHTLLFLVAITVTGIHGAIQCPRCTDPFDITSCTATQACHPDDSDVCEIVVFAQDNDRIEYHCLNSHLCTNYETPNCDVNVNDRCIYCCNSPSACGSLESTLFVNGVFQPNIGGTVSPGGTAQCKTQADIVLIMDSSGSIDNAEYASMLQFVADLTNNFEIGPNGVQFAGITFGTSAQKIWDLNTYSDNAQLEQGILSTPHLGGSTYTNLALDLARDDVFLAQYGARPNVPKIAIVLTDGQSTDGTLTSQEAAALQAAGVSVVSIGIGDGVDPQELATIASGPTDTFQVANFNVLDTIQNELAQKTCELTQTETCITQADIAFVLDSSGSISDSDYSTMLQFVVNLTRNFAVGPNDVQFAGVTFSDTAHKIFDLNSYTDQAQLEQAILSTTHLGGSTYTNLALDMVKDDVFTVQNGMRVDVPKIVVVLTDGQSTNGGLTAQEAAALKATGVTVVSVGIGNGVDVQELETIASGPTDTFQVANFDVLHTIEEELAKKTCDLTETNMCNEQGDILFLLDSSASIQDSDYNLLLEFVANLTQNFVMGPNGTQFGGIVYSTTAQKIFDLNTYTDHAQLEQGILQTPHLQGATYADLAMDLALQDSFTSQSGARPGIPKIVFVFTDGQSTNRTATLQEAQALKDAGASIITVGVGNDLDMTELQAMATSHTDAFQVTSYSALEAIENQLVNKACELSQITPCDAFSDILFILDSSSSIQHDDYQTLLQSVATLTRYFNMAPDSTQFGAITFSDTAQKIFDFNTYTDHGALEQGILQTTQLGGATYTNLALDMALQESFTAQNGARPNAQKLAVIFTDGQSTNGAATLQEAQLLKDSGVTVISVGIGADLDPQELEAVASSPSDVIQVAGFQDMDLVIRELASRACAQQAPVCVTEADIVFILDSSGSIDDADYDSMLQFVADITKNFNIGPNDVQFGGIIFSTTAQKIFDLNTYTDHAQLEQDILQTTHLAGSTYTNLGLDMALQDSFTAQNGARPGVPQIAIVFTDGQSTDPALTSQEAQALKASGVQVMAIGVGSSVDAAELQTIASSPSDVYQVAGFNVLDSIESQIANNTCAISSATTP